MSWFTEFLEESARQWQADADHYEFLATQAAARGDFLGHARAQGEAMSYRRVARGYRGVVESFGEQAEQATEDHDWDCTVADLVDLTTPEEVAA